MGQLQLPERFLWQPRVKPTGPVVIDRNNSITNGLRLCQLYGEYGTRNLVTSEDLGSTAVDFGYGRHGGFFKSPSYTGDNFVAAPAFDTTNWAGVSIVQLFLFDTTDPFPSLAYSGPTGGFFGNWYISRSGSGLEVRFGNDSGAFGLTLNAVADDLVYSAFTYDLAVESVWGAVNNGPLKINTNATTAAFAGVADKNHIGFGPSGEGRSWLKPIFYTFIFDRALTTAEVKSLYADPYQILKPSVPLVAFTSSAGLDNNRISSMHFQRHYEPIAMGT